MTKPKKPQQASKKTEALEVRVSHEQKTDFMAACAAHGRSASDVIRDAMRGYTRWGSMARAQWRMTMLGTIMVSITAGTMMFIGSPEASSTGDRLFGFADFRRYDHNYDQRLTPNEVLETIGRVQDIIEQRHDRPGEVGVVMGLLFARYPAANDLDISPLHSAPDSVSEGCWAALEAAWIEGYQAQFRRWDADEDGNVTAREFSDAQIRSVRSTFSYFDKDGDGVLTRDDYLAQGTPTEMPSPVEMPVHLRICSADLPRTQPPPVYESPVMTPEQADAMIQYGDTNNDLEVDFEEFLALRS